MNLTKIYGKLNMQSDINHRYCNQVQLRKALKPQKILYHSNDMTLPYHTYCGVVLLAVWFVVADV